MKIVKLAEYGLGEKPSTTGDAYSFGVMVLELFTGMSPTHESFSAELNLPRWVHLSFPQNLAQVIDPELLETFAKTNNLSHEGESSSDHMSPEAEYDCLIKVIEVGLCCTRDSPDERMSMKSALRSLKSAKHDLLKHATEEPKVDQEHC